ncbi:MULTISPECIES: hypothetical protein [Pseudanabaena]|jgi:hypothetical protein|uniref:hypothetical protein n=1 Tax=Pseudanabaena TaxID=1152 RepID=UPI00247A05B8|nr:MULTISPECIES: hypothetical protein [Pseudanabaena]MEA5489299.1 hypothetical protein [Pseudanabaena sp. CCNP1317]WGS74097.1 hypothetical protein OA858_08730 [Pseudanabaena galeata CCNP1313]
MSEFYQVTPSVAKALRKANLTASEWKIWSYLVEVDPWGDRYEEVETLAVMSVCDVSKATYYRAIAKFQDGKIFDFQDKGFNVRNLHGVRSLKNEKTVAEMRQTDKISDSQNCENSLKNEKTVAEMRQLSQNCENRVSKVSCSNGSGTPQISSEDPKDPDQIDQDESFNFENANPENLEISEQDALALIQANLDRDEKCDLKPVKGIDLINTPEKVANPISGDPFRRALEDFIISFLKIEISDEKRPAYFKRFKPEDWDKWQTKYKAANSPPVKVEQRDPVAEDPWRVENAIASMVMCKDFQSVENRLAIVEKTNPILATQLREKYLCS